VLAGPRRGEVDWGPFSYLFGIHAWDVKSSRVCVCTVRFCDREGVEHSAEVRAASVYEAVCRAWAIFKADLGTQEESYKAKEFVVEVHQEPKVFHVELEKLLAWLERFFEGPVLKRNREDDFRLEASAYSPMLCVARVCLANGSSFDVERYADFDSTSLYEGVLTGVGGRQLKGRLRDMR
jgi:hypothetical protein